MNLLNSNEFFLLEELVKKNFSAKYKDSFLGILWSVLKPLLIMIVFTIIFSTLFKGRIENYAVYFLAGKCIFDFFNTAISLSMGSIKNNQSLIRKTAVSKQIFVLSSILSEFINFVISLILLIFVMLVTGSQFYIFTSLFAIIPVISVTLMIFGFGWVLSIFCVYYTDIQHLWGVISLLLMYGSALFYPIDIIPQPYQQYMLLNPLFWVIDQFRALVVYGFFPDLLNMINAFLFSLIIFVFGLIVFKKYEPTIAMKL